MTGREATARPDVRGGGQLRVLNGPPDRSRWPIVGRDVELGTISRLLDEGAGTILVVGPAGTGRTRLAREASRVATSRGRPVLWATATRVTRLIPLAAMAHLITSPPPSADRPAVLRHAVSELTRGDDAGRSLIVVDDAHQLDELSVALLHQLVVAEASTIVLTAPADAVPDWAGELCKDGMAARLDLGPLSREDSDRLVAAVLGGVLDARTAERLWRLTLGNPQFLRGLVENGRDDGSLRSRDGLWWWDGEITLARSMVDLVCARLGDDDPDEHLLIEALATAGSIPTADLIELGSLAAVVALERRGVVTISRGTARLAHPLHAAATRTRMPESEAQWMRDRILRMSDPDGGGLSGDRVLQLLDLWPRHDGVSAGDDQLAQAAELANARLDHVAAERLARSATAIGGVRARLALIEAVQWQGRPTEVEALAVEDEPQAGSDRERTRLGVLRAVNLFCGLGRPTGATRVLDETAGMVTHAENRHALVATRAMLALLGGDPRTAVDLGRDMVEAGGGEAQPVAAAAVGGGLALLGRIEDAMSTIEAGWVGLETAGAAQATSSAFARIALAQAEVVTLMLGGRVDELGRRTRYLHEGYMGVPQGAGDAVAALHRGWADLAAGRVGRARDWMHQAVVGLREADPVGLLPVAGSQLAITEALLGDPVRARATLRDSGAEAIGDARMELFSPFRRLAEAWVRVAEDRDGGEVALEVAADAAVGGLSGLELTALHMATRMGRATDAAPRLDRLARTLGDPQSAALARHARALATDDGDVLEDVASEFVQQGALLRAADASAHAAVAHDRAGLPRRSASARARAHALALECGVAPTPALRAIALPRLTAREGEVARMAAHGMNNQAIASQLVVSVRTVETHLAKAYVKLGISGRSELNTMLPPHSGPYGSHDDPETRP